MAATAAATASFTVSKLLHSQKHTSSFSHTTFPAKPLCTSSSFSLKLTSQFPPKPLKSIKSTADETSTTVATVSTVAVGDTLPDTMFSFIHPSGDVELVPLSTLTENKKVILFAVPGAFTPTCSQKHLPGFAKLAKELKAKGVHHIACISVNDAFVMKHWKQDLKLNDDIMMLSDGCGEFTRAIGCELDLSDKPEGLGIRSRRYSMLVENNVVKVLNLEEGGAFTSSGAEDMLKLL